MRQMPYLRLPRGLTRRRKHSVIRGLDRAAELCGALPGREHALFGLALRGRKFRPNCSSYAADSSYSMLWVPYFEYSRVFGTGMRARCIRRELQRGGEARFRNCAPAAVSGRRLREHSRALLAGQGNGYRPIAELRRDRGGILRVQEGAPIVDRRLAGQRSNARGCGLAAARVHRGRVQDVSLRRGRRRY